MQPSEIWVRESKTSSRRWVPHTLRRVLRRWQRRRRRVSDPSSSKPAKKIVRVEDLATTVKLKRVQAKADASARKLEAEAKKAQAKVELRRMKLAMPAREAAALHLANFAGLYMLIAVLAFLYAVSTLEAELVAVVAGLITLLVTNISALLRSIVTEGKYEPKKPEGEGDGGRESE